MSAKPEFDWTRFISIADSIAPVFVEKTQVMTEHVSRASGSW